MTEEIPTDKNGPSKGKVDRLLTAYQIEQVADELVRRRRGERGDVSSLRDLKSYFNRQLLAARLSAADDGLLDGEIENLYRLLVDDAVTSGDRTRARSRIKSTGVDVNQLERDFVSREAIRSYFDRQGITPPRDDTDQVEKEADRIRQFRSKTASVTTDKLNQLRATDRISIGEFRTLVAVEIYCEDCGTQMTVDKLLEQKSCDCHGC